MGAGCDAMACVAAADTGYGLTSTGVNSRTLGRVAGKPEVIQPDGKPPILHLPSPAPQSQERVRDGSYERK